MNLARIPSILVAACAIAAISPGANAVAAGTTVFTNVKLITMTSDSPLEGKAVVIEDGRIKEIIDQARAGGVKGATIIDGAGGYLTPGLIDAHVHNYELIDYVNYVANGVTTTIGLGQSDNGPAILALAKDIAEGRVIGPRIYTTNKTIANHIDIQDPEKGRVYVRSLKAEGYDLVKVYNNIPEPVFDAVVDEAHKLGLSVFGHLPRTFPVKYSLSHGLDVVAHAEEFYFAYFGGARDRDLAQFDGSAVPDLSKAQKVIDLMVEHDVALIPNLTFTFVAMRFWDDEDATLADPELRYWPPNARQFWREQNSARRDQVDKRVLRDRIKYDLMHEFTRRARDAGVLIVAGTDAPVRGVIPGSSIHSELRELVKTGLSYREALEAATRNGGELIMKYVDRNARVGVIAPGYEADLVLVADNPLADIRNMKKIEGVMVDGVWRDKAELRRLRDELAERYAE